MPAVILVVDDDVHIRDLLAIHFETLATKFK